MTAPADLDAPKLLPCPFCGGAAKAFFDGGRWFAVCNDLNAARCSVGPVSDACLTEADATAAWNRRAPGWQPIVSAPKDGKFVLLGFTKPCLYGLGCWIARWNPDMDSWVGNELKVTGCWETEDAWFEPGDPTHWCALPEPPQ